jgi:hypothetical protein
MVLLEKHIKTENKMELKKSALAFSGMKFGQQVLNDFDGVILNSSVADYSRYGCEQFCRIGAAGIAAYAADEAVSYVEEYFPKKVRGLVSLAAVTIGAGAVINSFGNYFNAEQGLGVLTTTQNLMDGYQNNLLKLVTFNPSVDAGYLMGAFIGIKSGGRFLKNLSNGLFGNMKRKKMENKMKEN